MITPICALVAVINGLVHHSLLSTLYTVVAIGVLPFGFLAISAWVGILVPYHPMPLRYRWEHRRPRRRMLVRWLTLAVTPYVLVPALAALMLAPSLLLWGFTSPHGLSGKVPDHDLGLGVAVACAIALVCSVGGQRLGVWMAQRRRAKLADFLSDPVRG
jgi:hypothetical protein